MASEVEDKVWGRIADVVIWAATLDQAGEEMDKESVALSRMISLAISIEDWTLALVCIQRYERHIMTRLEVE